MLLPGAFGYRDPIIYHRLGHLRRRQHVCYAENKDKGVWRSDKCMGIQMPCISCAWAGLDWAGLAAGDSHVTETFWHQNKKRRQTHPHRGLLFSSHWDGGYEEGSLPDYTNRSLKGLRSVHLKWQNQVLLLMKRDESLQTSSCVSAKTA